MNCPNCGHEAGGKFCANCGAALVAAHCSSCQASLLPGANFCTQCGTRVRAAGPKSLLPWGIGAAAAVILAVAMFSLLKPQSPQPAVAGTLPAGSPQGTPPPLSGSMRENADRLFNRVMQAREGGDTAQARQFLPMAISAYQQAGDLDADGLYHLSILQTFSGDAAGGLESAEQLLRVWPTHVLGLHAAAGAARAQGDNAKARQFYEQILEAMPTERTRDLPEYRDHGSILPAIEAEANEFLRR